MYNKDVTVQKKYLQILGFKFFIKKKSSFLFCFKFNNYENIKKQFNFKISKFLSYRCITA